MLSYVSPIVKKNQGFLMKSGPFIFVQYVAPPIKAMAQKNFFYAARPEIIIHSNATAVFNIVGYLRCIRGSPKAYLGFTRLQPGYSQFLAMVYAD